MRIGWSVVVAVAVFLLCVFGGGLLVSVADKIEFLRFIGSFLVTYAPIFAALAGFATFFTGWMPVNRGV